MEHYTKKITCPEHGTVGHEATLYTMGHKYAGVWECDMDGTTGSCEHDDAHLEFIGSSPINVCDYCERVVEDGAYLFDERAIDCAD